MRASDHPVLAQLPEGWQLIDSQGPGPFITRATLARPDGSIVHWTSRGHRKGHLLEPGSRRRSQAVRLAWAMGLAFMIGSACFATGSFPPFFDAVAAETTAWTFFVGSVFFTGAGYLQFHEVQRSPAGVGADGAPRAGVLAYLGWQPRRIDWWAAAVQLLGTVFFNVSTLSATGPDLGAAEEQNLVWGPDVAGSVCFLVASWLAYSEVNRGILPRPDRSVGWRIAIVNLAGSIAFGLAAIGARAGAATGGVANLSLVNLGTFVGAVCFFAGAALLPVEAVRCDGGSISGATRAPARPGSSA